MSNPAQSSTCPRCGRPLSENSIDGLCASCLAAVNFATDTAAPQSSGSNATPPISPEELSIHFPHLEVIEFLGRGGMGVVYKARQKALGRIVALKLMAPERSDDPQFADRFQQEAKALAALSHPNIVTIHDFGQAGGFFYLLMEFVDGVNLRQAMNAGRLTPEQALAIVPPVCEALQYAHEHLIVHRDIKPENLLLDKAGKIKIADFGIAKMLGTDSVGDATESQPAGTPQYMAPEQRLHLQIDHRADIYSLGVVLYEMLTGELPDSKLKPPSTRVQVDVKIDEIVMRALEANRELRFSSATDFRTQVETVTSTSLTPASNILGVNRSWMTRVVEAAFGVTFSSPLAIQLTNLAALGFIASLAFLGISPLPGGTAWFGFSGFSGFFGFIGIALMVESWEQRQRRIREQQKLSGGPARSNTQAPTAELSRYALLGGCWIFVTLIAFGAACIGIYGLREGIRTSAISEPSILHWLVLTPILLVAVTGPFVTTILGCIAITRIRLSQGRIQGLPLAVFDILFYPLIGFTLVTAMTSSTLAKGFAGIHGNNGSIALIPRFATWVSVNNEVVVLLTVFITLIACVFFTRMVFRIVRRPVTEAEIRAVTIIERYGMSLALLAMLLALLGFGLGLLATIRPREVTWLTITLAVLSMGIAIAIALPLRRISFSKVAILVALVGMTLWPFLGFIISLRQARLAEYSGFPAPVIPVAHEGDLKVGQNVAGREASVTSQAVPTEIEFRLVSATNPRGTRKVMIEFERDNQYGLGLEFSQDVTAADDGSMPLPGYRDFQQKTFLGIHDSHSFTWQLPDGFGTAEVLAAIRSVRERGQALSRLPEGALIEFANIKHVDGWNYTLLARVRREGGAPYPTAPEGMSYSAENPIVTPADCVVQLQLEITDKGGNKRLLGEPLVFKTPLDRCAAVAIRWHVYGPQHSQHANEVIVDLVDHDTGVIFHRFSHGWDKQTTLIGLHNVTLPAIDESLTLAEPLEFSKINLVRAEQTAPPNAAVSNWWTLRMEVKNLGSGEGQSAPQFQMR